MDLSSSQVKRYTLEQKFDVNHAYCSSFLKQTLWGFMTGYMMSHECSQVNAARAYMEYFGMEDDEYVLAELYRKINDKVSTLPRNKVHLNLVGKIIYHHER